jgi:secreted protein with Ig-like and vWFA domain
MAVRWIHFRIDEQLVERARRAAEADRRSLSNWVALTIERALEEKPRESAEQSARPALLQRQRTRCALSRC